MDIQPILDGDRLAIARILTQVENNTPESHQALNELFPYTGRAHLVGVTGAPGTGKSSLVNRLAYHYRHPDDGASLKSIAVVAVDPTSPFSGGAVLGDRVRMRDLSGDPGVFIRSMASRGSLGGLAYATAGLVQVFDAAGFDIIMIETVGAGQAEVEIARLAHTTIVVEAPGLGDDIQAIKAGILEIADILVINKADRPGVENTERALKGMLSLAHPVRRQISHHGTLMQVETARKDAVEEESWIPPILKTIATEGDGIPGLVEEIRAHREHLVNTGDLKRRERARLENELTIMLKETLMQRWRQFSGPAEFQETVDRLTARDLSPWEAVDLLLEDGEG